jgi:hypothetical protein
MVQAMASARCSEHAYAGLFIDFPLPCIFETLVELGFIFHLVPNAGVDRMIDKRIHVISPNLCLLQVKNIYKLIG